MVPDNSDDPLITTVLPKFNDEKSHETLVISFGLELFTSPLIVILGPFTVARGFAVAGAFVGVGGFVGVDGFVGL
jgi:hypothetical protein